MPKAKSIAALQKELATKRRELAVLELKRTGLAKRLARVDKQIAALTGGAAAPEPRKEKKAAKQQVGKPARGPHVKQKPLAQVVQDVLATSGKAMRAVDVAAAVLAAGYKTKDKLFKSTVNHMLSKKPQFKRVSRGIYKLGATK